MEKVYKKECERKLSLSFGRVNECRSSLILLLFYFKPRTLKSFGSTFVQHDGFLSHGEAILGDFSELGDTPEIDLGAILERYDNVTPFSDKTRHDLHVLDDGVGEVAAVLAAEARDDGDAEVGEPVAQEHGA